MALKTHRGGGNSRNPLGFAQGVKRGLVMLLLPIVWLLGVVLVSGNAWAEDDGTGGWTLDKNFEINVYSSNYECVDADFSDGSGSGCNGYGWVIKTEAVTVKEVAGGGYYLNGGTDDVELYSGSVRLSLGSDELKVTVDNCWGGVAGCGMTWGAKTLNVPLGGSIREFHDNAATIIGDGKEYEGIDDTKISFGVGRIVGEDPVDGDGTTGTSSDLDPCWNAGLDSGGWIICPTINNLKYTAGPLESMVESWLTVETDLYNSDSPTHTVWEIMRNIANVFMIVFLLVIIFSQLTGYGIDNYGIKKMLPRLVIMAVLINLSFVICEIAVDLSNILGVGLRNLFGSVGEMMLADRGLGSYLEEFVGNVVTWIFAAAGVAGAAAPTALAIVEASGGGGVMVAIVIILALVVVVVALLLFFIMLGARMIIIIGCMALAPIAFAAFTLPNTQNWFKKWWEVFKAALIIFPICGVLGGVSVLIKAIVLGSSGIHLWMLVVALIAPFLPFFLLPMLLRSAISALGKVGGALTTMGQRFSGGMRGLSDSVRNSERFKDAAQYGKDMTAVRRAENTRRRFGQRYGVDANGNINRANMSARDLDRLTRAEQTINANTAREAQNEVGPHMVSADLAQGIAQANRDEQMIKDWETALAVGRVSDANGNTVNTNNMAQMADYHSQQLAAYAQAAANNDAAGMAVAMAQIKAAQNIMSKSSGGRDVVQANIAAAATGGQTAGLQEAASHLMDNFGDTYKNKNRGSHEMLSDLASGADVSAVADKVNNGSYAKAGTSKYDAESLVGADDGALKGLHQSVTSGSMDRPEFAAELAAIQSTANNALAQYQNGTLSIKPEVLTQIQDIANYQPPLPIPHQP